MNFKDHRYVLNIVTSFKEIICACGTAYFHIAQLPASFLPDCNQTKEIKIPQFSQNFLLTLGPEQENSTIAPFLHFFMFNQPARSLWKRFIMSTSPVNSYGSIVHFH